MMVESRRRLDGSSSTMRILASCSWGSSNMTSRFRNQGTTVNGLANLVDEGSCRERLLEKMCARIDHSVRCDCFDRVAGHVQHTETRETRDEQCGKLAAAHARHDHVREQQVQSAVVRCGDLE